MVLVVILGRWVRVGCARLIHVNLLSRLAGSRGVAAPAGPFLCVWPFYQRCPGLYILREMFLVRFPAKTTERSVVADYLKLPEVARRLDVSEKTARRMVKSGALPAVFIGGAYRISEEDLVEYLENAKVEPGKVEALPSPKQPNFNGLLEEERRRAELAEWL